MQTLTLDDLAHVTGGRDTQPTRPTWTTGPYVPKPFDPTAFPKPSKPFGDPPPTPDIR